MSRRLRSVRPSAYECFFFQLSLIAIAAIICKKSLRHKLFTSRNFWWRNIKRIFVCFIRSLCWKCQLSLNRFSNKWIHMIFIFIKVLMIQYLKDIGSLNTIRSLFHLKTYFLIFYFLMIRICFLELFQYIHYLLF